MVDPDDVVKSPETNKVRKLIVLIVVIAGFMIVGRALQVNIAVGDWAGGLKVRDIRKGSGLEAKAGYLVRVHYRGMLPDGTEILNTRSRTSHQWRVGDGTVIAGIDRAVVGMRPGGVRRAKIPYTLHYGQFGYGDKVPPYTTLTFEIEMLDVATGPWIKSPHD